MLGGISHFCVAHPFIASAIQTLGAALIARRVLGPGDDRRWLSTAEGRYCGGMGMTLNIPDSVLQGLRIPEGEIAQRLRSELAIALYVLRSAIARQGRRTRGGESNALRRDGGSARDCTALRRRGVGARRLLCRSEEHTSELQSLRHL